MTEQPPGWPRPHATPADYRPLPAVRPPSGLFPGTSPRPRWREPHPVRLGPLLAGIGSGASWVLLLGMLGRDLRGYAWWTLLAAVSAWLAAWLLARLGDRGAAAGVAMSTAVGWSLATGLVALRWAVTGDWPLW